MKIKNILILLSFTTLAFVNVSKAGDQEKVKKEDTIITLWPNDKDEKQPCSKKKCDKKKDCSKKKCSEADMKCNKWKECGVDAKAKCDKSKECGVAAKVKCDKDKECQKTESNKKPQVSESVKAAIQTALNAMKEAEKTKSKK